MLIVAPEIGLIALVLIVKDRMAEVGGRSRDSSCKAVQDIKRTSLDRSAILKRRVYRLIGTAKIWAEPNRKASRSCW